MYREEVIARKKAHNALEDAKGKIRVFARVRPLLEFEAAKKQASRRAFGAVGGRDGSVSPHSQAADVFEA